jgi:LysM repeat protein
MNLAATVARILIVMVLGLGCAGCWKNGTSEMDEEKDPNLLKGRSLFAMNDYIGASAAWEKSLQANPRNAEAHFELLVVNAQKLNDYATAIYYGNRFLKLKPKDRRLQTVSTIMTSCKQELAKDCFPGPVTPDMINRFEKLDKTNKLQQALIAQLSEKLFIATSRPPATLLSAVSNAAPVQPGRVINAPSSPAAAVTPTIAAKPEPSKSKQYKTYTVKARDTVGRISKEYNVSVTALTEANPGLNPKKIRAGQTLNIPVR